MISCHTESVLAGLDGLLWEGDHVFTSKEWEKIERAREMEVFFFMATKSNIQANRQNAHGVLGIKPPAHYTTFCHTESS